MLALAVFVVAFAILAAVVTTEDARSPRRAFSAWRVIAFLVALTGLAIFSFGMVLLGIMLFSTPPRGPEGHFPTFLAGTLCSLIGGPVFGLVVLGSRTAFGRRATLLAKMALAAAVIVFIVFAWHQISWRIR